MQELYDRLVNDLKLIGIEVNYTLELKPFSKKFFGCYNPNSNKVTIYVYQDVANNRLYPYDSILLTAIHESVHCIQWNDPDFVRIKGVMHNEQFYELYNMYKGRAKILQTNRALNLLKEVLNSEKLHSQGAFSV